LKKKIQSWETFKDQEPKVTVGIGNKKRPNLKTNEGLYDLDCHSIYRLKRSNGAEKPYLNSRASTIQKQSLAKQSISATHFKPKQGDRKPY
jgi:hypothetical protein